MKLPFHPLFVNSPAIAYPQNILSIILELAVHYDYRDSDPDETKWNAAYSVVGVGSEKTSVSGTSMLQQWSMRASANPEVTRLVSIGSHPVA
ncbi:hypothetical protein ACTXT7_004946 [Hymenolepis weldensis]